MGQGPCELLIKYNICGQVKNNFYIATLVLPDLQKKINLWMREFLPHFNRNYQLKQVKNFLLLTTGLTHLNHRKPPLYPLHTYLLGRWIWAYYPSWPNMLKAEPPWIGVPQTKTWVVACYRRENNKWLALALISRNNLCN